MKQIYRGIATVLVSSLMLAGCGEKEKPLEQAAMVQEAEDRVQGTETVDSALPIDEPAKSPVPVEGLEAIQQKIYEHWDDIAKKHAIALQSMGSYIDYLGIDIRSFGDVERVLSEADIKAIKKSLFEIAGEEFPLKLSVMECCTGAALTGKITEVDTVENRILVVNENEKNGDSDDPVAHWVSLTEDAKVFVKDGDTIAIFDETLVGREVKAWTTGLVLTSYPGHVSGVKVMVE